MGRPLKRRIKRLTFQLLVRPLMRRYDRIGADLALLGLETSRELEAARQEIAGLTSELQELGPIFAGPRLRGTRSERRYGHPRPSPTNTMFGSDRRLQSSMRCPDGSRRRAG